MLNFTCEFDVRALVGFEFIFRLNKSIVINLHIMGNGFKFLRTILSPILSLWDLNMLARVSKGLPIAIQLVYTIFQKSKTKYP